MFIDKFLSLFRLEVIKTEEGDDYIRRYHIVNNSWFPFKIYIHNILRSDMDRDLHDHPWNFTSLILKGGYTEYNRIVKDGVAENVATEKKRFSLIRHRGDEAHRLELAAPCWTFVIIGRKYREWGFYTADGWKHNQDYLKEKSQVEHFQM